MKLSGYLYLKQSSQRHDAEICLGDDGVIEFCVDGQLFREQLTDISVSDRLGATPRTIGFSNGMSFETAHNDAIDHWLQRFNASRTADSIYRLESHRFIAAACTLFLLVLIYVMVEYGIPNLAKVLAQRMPDSVSRHLAQGTLELLDDRLLKPSNLSQTRQIQLRDALIEALDVDVQIEFRSVDDSIGPNAFALPDGTIVFTDHLIKLADNDEQILAVFAHEVGHIVYDHSMRHVLQSSGLALIFMLVVGDINGASTAILSAPAVFMELSYSREFEREADDYAYQFLSDHDVKLESFAIILERMSAWKPDEMSLDKKISNNESSDNTELEQSYWQQVTPYLSSHPQTENRIRRFRQ